jgi:ribonuclease P protein component
MPKKQRITRADFSSLTEKRPQRSFGLYWTLSTSPLPSSTQSTLPCFACVVSKKVAAHAVDRNRIKRHCREIFRTVPEAKLATSSYIFYAKKEARDATHSQHLADITRLIEQNHLLP